MKPQGYVAQRKRDGKWFARLTWTDEATGKRIDRTRFGGDEQHARSLLAELIAEASPAGATSPTTNGNSSALATSPTTFKTVAAQYSAHKVKPAQCRNDRKIAGLRSERAARLRIAVLVDYFGDTPVDRVLAAPRRRI